MMHILLAHGVVFESAKIPKKLAQELNVLGSGLDYKVQDKKEEGYSSTHSSYQRQNPLAHIGRIINPWIGAALKQLFAKASKREGKFRLTHLAVQRMHEYTLSEKDIVDVFRYGEEVKKDMIIRKYPSRSIGIIVKKDQATEEQIVITCWKR